MNEDRRDNLIRVNVRRRDNEQTRKKLLRASITHDKRLFTRIESMRGYNNSLLLRSRARVSEDNCGVDRCFMCSHSGRYRELIGCSAEIGDNLVDQRRTKAEPECVELPKVSS